MAAKMILPGAGSAETTEAFTESSTTGADTYDIRRLYAFIVQQEFTTGSPGGDFQIEETFDGTNWANLGSAISAADGGVTKFDQSGEGPFGTIRINATGLTGSSVELTLHIEGVTQAAF